MLSLLFIHLYSISGNRRLGVVTPLHNRFAEKFRKTIGLVMELCPLQVDIGPEDTLLTVLKKIRRESRETLSYYQFGSDSAMQSGNFDVMFNFHPIPELSISELAVTAERIHSGHGAGKPCGESY